MHHFPIINKTNLDDVVWSDLMPLSFKSIKAFDDNSDRLILMFSHDKDLNRLWNNPLRYVPRFSTATLISTPDFSAYSSMNYNEIRHNIYKNRWLGKTWQNYGCNVIPTIQWCQPDTYDICFGGVERGSAVVISTLGCKSYVREFLEGFNEMKRSIDPELIIVVGDMIQGMTGKFVNYRYKETFSKRGKLKHVPLFEINPIFEYKEVI